MSKIHEDLKYTRTHEWVRSMDDGSVIVGISDYAQDLLGDLVFVELPEVGATYRAGEECAVVESVKAASDVNSPISGKIVAVNDSLSDNPDAVNRDPYGDGWLFRLQPAEAGELEDLLDAADYQAAAEAEEH